ncbi:hypothetical protein VNI00_014555 [Paramarasmius palmivorus]|uniref:Fungal lipase-type domain-containing protein n=1 Tax=Paramarasmius palmivorus TaxID=297713 RepID=A0AAW0BTS9_9AGAR
MSLSIPVIGDIHDAHARQLAYFSLPDKEVPDDKMPIEVPPEFLTVQNTLDWIEANREAIQAAKDAQCTSKSPDALTGTPFSSVFSKAPLSIYGLKRQESKIYEAVKAARDGDFDAAVDYIKEAQESIQAVADALDCTFVQLCDFPHESPEGTFYQSGAFCGLFVSNNTDMPFMGVAFKGTTRLNLREVKTDLNWDPIVPDPPEIAWGALVHGGFFKGLFGRFKSKGGQRAFDIIMDKLKEAYDDHGGNPILHFTGHSLGGAYCTLTYGEFLRRQAESAFSKYRFGDMYSLAAPRVCMPPFFQEVNNLTRPGGGKYLFRIVNSKDPVPTVPPRKRSQIPDYPFMHVGGAWELTQEGPQKMADEPPPVDPQPLLEFIWDIPYHSIKNYYAAWQKTPHD